MNPVLQHLSSRNQDAISSLLRGSDRSAAADPESPDVRWMAGVYLADELTSLVRLRDGSLEGQVETTLFVDAKWRRRLPDWAPAPPRLGIRCRRPAAS